MRFVKKKKTKRNTFSDEQKVWYWSMNFAWFFFFNKHNFVYKYSPLVEKREKVKSLWRVLGGKSTLKQRQRRRQQQHQKAKWSLLFKENSLHGKEKGHWQSERILDKKEQTNAQTDTEISKFFFYHFFCPFAFLNEWGRISSVPGIFLML